VAKSRIIVNDPCIYLGVCDFSTTIRTVNRIDVFEEPCNIKIGVFTPFVVEGFKPFCFVGISNIEVNSTGGLMK
jgi:hypothetical protein